MSDVFFVYVGGYGDLYIRKRPHELFQKACLVVRTPPPLLHTNDGRVQGDYIYNNLLTLTPKKFGSLHDQYDLNG